MERSAKQQEVGGNYFSLESNVTASSDIELMWIDVRTFLYVSVQLKASLNIFVILNIIYESISNSPGNLQV